jgi:hypothetical protein
MGGAVAGIAAAGLRAVSRPPTKPVARPPRKAPMPLPETKADKLRAARLVREQGRLAKLSACRAKPAGSPPG